MGHVDAMSQVTTIDHMVDHMSVDYTHIHVTQNVTSSVSYILSYFTLPLPYAKLCLYKQISPYPKFQNVFNYHPFPFCWDFPKTIFNVGVCQNLPSKLVARRYIHLLALTFTVCISVIGSLDVSLSFKIYNYCKSIIILLPTHLFFYDLWNS